MGQSEHTPGPWRIRENPRNDQETCDLSICGDIFILADLTGPQYAHQIANARLIAAAPELLEALEGMLRLAETAGASDRIICYEARQAIAKARGHE